MTIATEAAPGANAPVKRSRRAKKLPIAEKPGPSEEATTPGHEAGLHTAEETGPVLVEKELLKDLSKYGIPWFNLNPMSCKHGTDLGSGVSGSLPRSSYVCFRGSSNQIY